MSDQTSPKKTRKKREQGANLTAIQVKKLVEYVGEEGIVSVSTKWLREIVTKRALDDLNKQTEQVVEAQEEEEKQAEASEAAAEVASGVQRFDFGAPKA